MNVGHDFFNRKIQSILALAWCFTMTGLTAYADEQPVSRNQLVAMLERGETDFSNLDLRGLDITDLDFSGSNLFGVDMRNANLSGAKLRGCNLDMALLRGANLTRADLRDTSLFATVLAEATLKNSD